MGTRILRGSVTILTDEMNLGEIKEAIEITGDVAGVPPDAHVTIVSTFAVTDRPVEVTIHWELKDPEKP